jgi:hypothetical protein
VVTTSRGFEVGARAACGEAAGCIEAEDGTGGSPDGVACSLGESSCVGETLGPRPLVALEVVMESEDVAVVVPSEGASTLTVSAVSRSAGHASVS